MAGEDRDRILKYFVHRKSDDVFFKKNYYLQKKTDGFSPDPNSGLYIDACFLESELTDNEYAAYIPEALYYMRSLGCTNISAKPHPLNKRTVLNHICKSTNSNYVEINDTVDVVIPSIRPSIITSHVSTVLIDYAEQDNQLQVVSMLDEIMISKLANCGNVKSWIKVAKKHGVKFQKLNGNVLS